MNKWFLQIDTFVGSSKQTYRKNMYNFQNKTLFGIKIWYNEDVLARDNFFIILYRNLTNVNYLLGVHFILNYGYENEVSNTCERKWAIAYFLSNWHLVPMSIFDYRYSLHKFIWVSTSQLSNVITVFSRT